jgi:excisionase family DNA binding protein
MSKRLYSVAEAADELNVSTKTIRRYISQGHLTAIRVGPRLLRIPAASLACLLDGGAFAAA